MKLFFALIALVAVVSFATPLSDHGKLSVSGRKILDKNGNEYVLRGMSMFWNRTDWEGGKFYKQSTVTTLAGSSWNSNVVRAAIGNGSVSDAKNFMDWTYSAGIYVIIDWHVHSMSLSSAKNFFGEVAKYASDKNYNHVLYEVFNEPIDQTWASIKSDAEKLIDTIRVHDKDGLIIVGTPDYSSDIPSAKENPITGDRAKNVLYTLHFYSSDADHAGYRTRLKNAYCQDFPVFISEWGTSNANGGGTINWDRTNTWMSLVESLGISWANWSIVDKDETSAALTNNCCSGGTFADNNLSASGKYVQRIIKQRNSGQSISSTNSSSINVSLTQESSECSGSSGSDVPEKDGIVKFSQTTNAVNFSSISGAQDSVTISNAVVIRNSANSFNVSYNLTEIPQPGIYRMRLRYGTSANNATVSWQGTGLQSGSDTLSGSGNIGTFKYSDNIIMQITDSPSTPVNLTINSNGTNNFALLSVFIGYLTSDDSLRIGLIDENGEINSVLPISKTQSIAFEVSGSSLILHSGGNLEIYSLQGKRVAQFNMQQSGQVSLKGLTSGAYMAVLRKSGQSYAKTIYLK